MKNRNEEWLDRMLDAALGETGDSAVMPDFAAIRSEAGNRRPAAGGRRGFFAHRRGLIAAVVVGAAAAAVLPSVRLGRRSIERNQAVREEHLMLAEELIGGTIFDEGLFVEEPWPTDAAEPTDAFDI